jgi:hypothetical protein
MQIRPSQIMAMLGIWDSSVADCRGEWAVRLPHTPPHGERAPLLADEARSAPAFHGIRDLTILGRQRDGNGYQYNRSLKRITIYE